MLSRGHPDDVPWHRVVRSDGSLTQGARQRVLLEAEGVPFRGDRVDMRVARIPSMWLQREITLRPRPRGFHLVTREVLEGVPELGDVRVGLLHVFIQPHVGVADAERERLARRARRLRGVTSTRPCPEDAPYWTHTIEGPDDMPAHIKASLLGPSLSLPVAGGRLARRHLAGHLPVRAPRPRRRPRRWCATLSGE